MAKNNNSEVPKRAETEVAKSIYIVVVVAAAVSFVKIGRASCRERVLMPV